MRGFTLVGIRVNPSFKSTMELALQPHIVRSAALQATIPEVLLHFRAALPPESHLKEALEPLQAINSSEWPQACKRTRQSPGTKTHYCRYTADAWQNEDGLRGPHSLRNPVQTLNRQGLTIRSTGPIAACGKKPAISFWAFSHTPQRSG